MKLSPFTVGQIPTFLALAERENWVTEPWEFRFLLSRFPEGCWSACDENGEAVAFVTALRHERSGWIGNLIVRDEWRGRGIGQQLFVRALDALRSDGAETVWLTASQMGKGLYERHGFQSLDTIVRWSGSGRQHHHSVSSGPEPGGLAPGDHDLDAAAWGDRREGLLEAAAQRGRTLSVDGAFLVMQPCRHAVQLGPFAARSDHAAGQLLATAVRAVPRSGMLYLDAPASNRAALRLFNRARMRIMGTNELMYAGVHPVYRPELLYGMATMGSCG